MLEKKKIIPENDILLSRVYPESHQVWYQCMRLKLAYNTTPNALILELEKPFSL